MKPRWHEVFRSLQAETGATPPNPVLRAAAAGLSTLYGLGARARRGLYDRGWLQPRRLPCQVLSIGNLAVGGVGKTPLTAYLAQRFQAAGRRVAILSRGYGGKLTGSQVISDGRRIFFKPPEAGDEVYLLARKLPGIPVLSGADRYEAGLQAWQAFHPDLILLDDGFQHFQLHRDLDVVLLDASRPFANGRLLPRGPLREPVNTLARPLVLVLTRYDHSRDEATWKALRTSLPAATVLRAAFHLSGAVIQPEGRQVSLATLTSLKLAALAGLARPEVFSASLQASGFDLKHTFVFPDHHTPTPEELAEVIAGARGHGVDAMITTEKDWVKMTDTWPAAMPLYVVSLETELLDPWPEILFPLSLPEVANP